MSGSIRRRLGLALAALITIVLAAWLGRGWLADWTHARLAARHQRQLEQLPDTDAARFIERLADADDQYLDLIVAALSDPRPAVADAAEEALQSRIRRWSQGRSSDVSSRVATLARLLANSAERIPLDRRPFVQNLAQRLLTWPVDGRLVDARQLIADCEMLLRLPLPPAEVRIASLPPEATDVTPLDLQPESLPRSSPPLPLPDRPLPAFPLDNSPAVAFPRQPDPLEGASREKPNEPRQFIAPKAIRISDE